MALARTVVNRLCNQVFKKLPSACEFVFFRLVCNSVMTYSAHNHDLQKKCENSRLSQLLQIS